MWREDGIGLVIDVVGLRRVWHHHQVSAGWSGRRTFLLPVERERSHGQSSFVCPVIQNNKGSEVVITRKHTITHLFWSPCPWPEPPPPPPPAPAPPAPDCDLSCSRRALRICVLKNKKMCQLVEYLNTRQGVLSLSLSSSSLFWSRRLPDRVLRLPCWRCGTRMW